RRLDRPALLLLEDLHWLHGASLPLLARITRLAAERPLAVVANYRDDERPRLRDELPGVKVLSLRRLDRGAIGALGASMLGPETLRREGLIDLLERETEGNPFFLVEVVRALAEEAGGLRKVAVATIPNKVFAGGLDRIIHRRLAR